eukprot:scaffold139437_cov28-Prasinocladus_malaysianus.AAC.1
MKLPFLYPQQIYEANDIICETSEYVQLLLGKLLHNRILPERSAQCQGMQQTLAVQQLIQCRQIELVMLPQQTNRKQTASAS